MEEPDGSYAPQSPDLTAYHSAYSSNPPQPTYLPPSQQQSYPQSSHIPPEQYGSYEFDQQPIESQADQQSHNMPRKRVAKHAADNDEWHSGAETHGLAGNGKKQKMEVDCDKPAPGVEEGIEIKTKFPVARIKRIMQADEDIGKVAQVTPTAVSKALELFMISVTMKAAKEARAASAKRVTAGHLKAAMTQDEQFDFLAEIMSKVPDAPAPKKEEDSEEGAEGKKKRGGTRRRKKEADDT